MEVTRYVRAAPLHSAGAYWSTALSARFELRRSYFAPMLKKYQYHIDVASDTVRTEFSKLLGKYEAEIKWLR